VKFHKDSRLSVASQQVQELETYYCSKRYVDIRNLATTMRDHAEEVVKYYEVQNATASKTNKAGTGGGGKRSATSAMLGTLEKVLHKPVEAAQFITNTEPSSSSLVSDLDAIFHNAGRKLINSGSSSRKSVNSTSKRLVQGAPVFVREIMEGVDEFYAKIYSEKRQFIKKTKFDHVKKIAERRMSIIDGAFGAVIRALTSADLESVSKREPLESIPAPLEMLVKSVEKFLLTDVVVDEGEEEDTPAVVEKTADKAVPPPQHQNSLDSSISNSMVNPLSTRRRCSVYDREEEVRKCKEAAELIFLEEKEDVKGDANHSAATEENEGTKVSMVTEMGVLPDHPIDFGLIVAVGAIFFKVLEGRVMAIQMDMLLLFGIACGLIGYQLAPRPSVVYAEKSGVISPARHVTIASPQSSPTKEGQTKEMTKPDRRSLVPGRSGLVKSTGHINLGNSTIMKRQSLHLIQASMRNVKTGTAAEEESDKGAEEKNVVPANTFPKFPEGAAIGTHLNCWSSPPSANFHVRGPNYLKDKKKVPSGDYIFPCRGCDLFLTDNPPENIGRNRAILKGKLRDVPTFIINYRLPWGIFISYHEIPERFLPFLRRGHGHGDLSVPLPSMADMPAGERAMCNFLLSDSEDKNEVMKLVPVVVEGPWMVKRVVGGKPAIVGKKLPISYVYQPPEEGLADYLEADLDIVSSAAARNVLAVVRSYTQVLTIDLGYVVQGNKEEELPEQMMLGLRLHGLDPLTAELLPEFDDGTVMSELEDDTGNDTD